MGASLLTNIVNAFCHPHCCCSWHCCSAGILLTALPGPVLALQTRAQERGAPLKKEGAYNTDAYYEEIDQGFGDVGVDQVRRILCWEQAPLHMMSQDTVLLPPWHRLWALHCDVTRLRQVCQKTQGCAHHVIAGVDQKKPCLART
jgi:hypothetical protein